MPPKRIQPERHEGLVPIKYVPQLATMSSASAQRNGSRRAGASCPPSERRASKGDTLRTASRGKSPNNSATDVPTATPSAIAHGETKNGTSAGNTPASTSGSSFWMPIPTSAPTEAPDTPSTNTWMTNTAIAWCARAPMQRSTATVATFPDT